MLSKKTIHMAINAIVNNAMNREQQLDDDTVNALRELFGDLFVYYGALDHLKQLDAAAEATTDA